MLPGLLFSNDTKDNKFVEQFPFSTVENILVCDEVLKVDSDVKEKLVCLYWKTVNFYSNFLIH